MKPGEPSDAPEYTRRFQVAARLLDSATQAVAMARLVAQARLRGASGASILVGGERLRTARRVGLLASSMNPLTRAHLALADAARSTARLDAFCWVATAVTIDKEQVQRATLADRLIQARAHALAAGDGLLLLNGGLYVEQARAAHALLGGSASLALIVGFDKVVQIFDPRYYTDRDAALRELFAEAALVVAPREGAGEADLRALLARPENRPFAHRVGFCPLPDRYVADSSTEARALAASGEYGQPLRDLLAPEGLALAECAQPYAAPRQAAATDLGDAYSARQALIAALSDLSLGDLRDTPGLRQLIEWSAVADARGTALRAWARGAGPHALADLRAALSAR